MTADDQTNFTRLVLIEFGNREGFEPVSYDKNGIPIYEDVPLGKTFELKVDEEAVNVYFWEGGITITRGCLE